MAGKKKSRKRDVERRREAAAARREKHAKMMLERQGDPRFIQQKRNPTGRTLSFDEQSEDGRQLKAALLNQRQAFIEKFGREPGPQDPVFFDPNADAPTPLGADAQSDMWDDMLDAAEQAGIDPSYVHAARELGYWITESNQHLFSAMEAEAFFDAVSRHRGDVDDTEDGDEDADEQNALELLDELNKDTAHFLEIVVGRTLCDGGDDEPARRFVGSLVSSLDEDDAGDDDTAVPRVFVVLLAWLVGAKERGIASAEAVNWVNAHLGADAAAVVIRVAGLVGYPFAPAMTIEEMNEELGTVAIAAMIWLAAGVASTAGNGDAVEAVRSVPIKPTESVGFLPRLDSRCAQRVSPLLGM